MISKLRCRNENKRKIKLLFNILLFFILAWTVLCVPVAQAQLAQQYFPSELPGYSADSTGNVSLREVVQHRHTGIPVGAYILKPTASQQFGYRTSILGAPHTSSASLVTSAGLGVNSNWSRHAIGASMSVTNQAYPSISAANYTDWSAAAGGMLNLRRDMLSLGYTHSLRHLSATDLGNFGVGYPVPYSTDDVRMSYHKNWTRFALIPTASYDNYSFGQSQGNLPAASRNLGSLSHQLEMQVLQGRFEISKSNALVAVLRGSEAQFTPHAGQLSNDYVSGGGFVGIDLRADPVLQYRLLAGGETRRFTRGGGNPVTTPTAEAQILWMPDKLNTLTFSGQRGLFDPTSPFSRNQVMSSAQIIWDRELRKDVFFHGGVSYARTDSRSSTAGTRSRQQNQIGFRAALDWQFTRDIKFTLNYSHTSSYTKHGVPAVLDNGFSHATFTNNSITFGVAFAR
ncbi:hypothetical protein EDC15_11570 [Acetobacter aceti NBRC 14818]|nr:outer membrane beta-barrel protein [Acetobacter aceti]TCS31837.1 hypothetical protein EDC15_11570 [Acetobacter aceti NBRC 14818]